MSEAMAMLKAVEDWSRAGLIRAVDYQLARFAAEQPGASAPLVVLCALVSHELAAGNVCLPLTRLSQAEDYWPQQMAAALRHYDWARLCPDQVILGDEQSEQPTLLVLDRERLYLHRYWQYETHVAQQLNQRAVAIEQDPALLQQGLARLFPPAPGEIDWQKVAAALALQKRFSVISGGPGTGKTTTVIKLLALYIEQQRASGSSINIRLAAPTGKAAARLAESISSAKQRLALEPELADAIPAEASTLHRLLGVIPNSIRFRHSRDNPLHLDLLVLDEASMVDLPMMARLLDALPHDARLILLGDRDQLASVEAGSVLGDICSWPDALCYSQAQAASLERLCELDQTLPTTAEPGFADCLALLRKSYRFHDQSGIGYLARAVNAGQPQQVREELQKGYADLNYCPLSQPNYEAMLEQMVLFHADALRRLKAGATPRQQLQILAGMQLLCALREGPYGVSGLNQRIRQGLAERGLVAAEGSWYAGRPVMISRNDPALELFNGDIGVAVEDEDGELMVWFEQNGEPRPIRPSRLPEHDTVYAMTVHKSQGSEFDNVVLLLPPQEAPVLSRELLYTGITRAKKQLFLYATESALTSATQRRTERAGGLAVRLWSGHSG
ncbi:exodeoxyribonuclease V subunit alpha [Neptuniibacter halophilus]|uniref:exodeoxyribonuclease V subunit alpha n=1 Tax=Neptuniibacter halophilus TaxID=651666 RepID=UPI0025745332|nr:exodeoxyribonuclease V subunit alpha [Neptuniibacter halophilus]